MRISCGFAAEPHVLKAAQRKHGKGNFSKYINNLIKKDLGLPEKEPEKSGSIEPSTQQTGNEPSPRTSA